jgi:hypothetical protein
MIEQLIANLESADRPSDELTRAACLCFLRRDDYSELASLLTLACSDGIEAIGSCIALTQRLLPGVRFWINQDAFDIWTVSLSYHSNSLLAEDRERWFITCRNKSRVAFAFLAVILKSVLATSPDSFMLE